MAFVQDIKWIFVVAGMLFIAAAVFGRGQEPLVISVIKIPRLQDTNRQIISGVVGVAFLVFGIIIFSGIWPPVRAVESENGGDATVTIDLTGSSQSGGKVTVTGTINPPDSKNYLVVIVGKDPDGDCYFLKRPHLSVSEGSWKETFQPPILSPSWYGKPGEPGRDATFLVVDGDRYPGSTTGNQISCPTEIIDQIAVFIKKP